MPRGKSSTKSAPEAQEEQVATATHEMSELELMRKELAELKAEKTAREQKNKERGAALQAARAAKLGTTPREPRAAPAAKTLEQVIEEQTAAPRLQTVEQIAIYARQRINAGADLNLAVTAVAEFLAEEATAVLEDQAQGEKLVEALRRVVGERHPKSITRQRSRTAPVVASAAAKDDEDSEESEDEDEDEDELFDESDEDEADESDEDEG